VEIHRGEVIIPLEVWGSPVFDHNGEVVYAIAGFQDISRRKTLETERQWVIDQLWQSEQRYATLAETAPVGIFRTDTQGNCIYGNERGFAMIGLTQEEFMGAGWSKTLYPDDRVLVMAAWHQTIDFDLTFSCEYRLIRPDGSLIWVYGQGISEKDNQGNIIGFIGTITDITDRKLAEISLSQSEARFRRLTEHIPGVIYRYVSYTDGSDGFTYISPQFKNLYEVELDQEINPNIDVWSFILPEDIERLKLSIEEAKQDLKPWSDQYRIITPSGRIKWAEAFSVPELQDNGDIFWDGFIIDITERKQAEQLLANYNRILEAEIYERTLALAEREAALQQANLELERLVSIDGLTQVANRRCFDQFIAQEWQRLAREKQPLSLIFCDVDYFKLYNDHYGHQQGDDCLKKIAQAMSQVVKRPADLVARYGGEEFAIILPNTLTEGAITVAQAIQTEIQQLKLQHEHSKVSLYVTISLGIATIIPDVEQSPELLINQADTALYAAKKQGRNQFKIYSVN
jgi:diguanylate cyclase (GGDEF)-like protein/PAS domain S-box-containing protein